jgi:hypothetical protein
MIQNILKISHTYREDKLYYLQGTYTNYDLFLNIRN